MKDIRPKLIELFKQGNCTPQISVIAKKLKEPATTIHYNIKKLEEEVAIKAYKAVFDYKKIGLTYCTYVMVNLVQEKYADPEEVAMDIANDPKVESVDITTGDYEMLMKIRTKDIDEFYDFIKSAAKKYGFAKVISMASLKQLKTEFVK
jgi:Lrp/AsnC family transcriptional regulator for asnA, asnC and gidA